MPKIHSGYALILAIGILNGIPATAQGTSITPTVKEVESAFTGLVLSRVTKSGRDIKIRYLPGGKLRTEVETVRGVSYRDRKWRVREDSSICTQDTGGGETCRKTIKEGNLIFSLDEQGKKKGKGLPIKK